MDNDSIKSENDSIDDSIEDNAENREIKYLQRKIKDLEELRQKEEYNFEQRFKLQQDILNNDNQGLKRELEHFNNELRNKDDAINNLRQGIIDNAKEDEDEAKQAAEALIGKDNLAKINQYKFDTET